MNPILLKVKDELTLLKDTIIKNQKEEYNNLICIAQKLLNESYNNNFPLNTRSSIQDIVFNEKIIEEYSVFIRERWMEKVFYHTYKLYKSPEYGQVKTTLTGRRIDYEYERTLEPTELEKKIHISYDGYESFSMLFANAMSTLSAIYAIITKLFTHNTDEIKGLAMCGYYESIALSVEYRKFIEMDYIINDKDSFEYDINNYNFFIIEPVRTTFELNQTDVEKFLNDLINKSNDSLKVIVFDSSLLGQYFDIESILSKLKKKKNLIIINFRSALKLDQQGMEFSNCGLFSLYLEENLIKIRDYIQNYMTQYRKIAGTGLSFFEVCLLDNDVCLSDGKYASKILNNNADFFAGLLKTSKEIVNKVTYPYFEIQEKMFKTPYLYIKLARDKREEYEKLYSIIKYYCEKFNLNLSSRNSFGFRNISLEYFMNLNDKSLVLKIAVGSLKGMKFHLIMKLLNEIMSISREDFDNLYITTVDREYNNESYTQ
ncbi:hypothetical protein [Priestia koreensis]|uniref:hypothetical protein n=1 Tax=Priestia koreensis TaxID=284581 RepID=UPI00203D1821|nr:hypothetical protein [Priestia koreensis]MCM3005883.1 hypothetical protein [Priestia koreensis]